LYIDLDVPLGGVVVIQIVAKLQEVNDGAIASKTCIAEATC